VEGKDQPDEGEYAVSKYELETGSKVAALCLRMTKSIHGTGRVVVLDSGFGYVPAVIQLKAHGLFSLAYVQNT
jgi:hypothetical protein